MNLVIKRKQTQELAAKLVELTGDDVEDVVQHALEQTVAEAERRAKLTPRSPDEQEKVRKALLALMARAQQLPDSGLSVEEALPYDENGLPV